MDSRRSLLVLRYLSELIAVATAPNPLCRWDLVQLVVLLYALLRMPVLVAFNPGVDASDRVRYTVVPWHEVLLFLLDLLAGFVIALDVPISLRTGYKVRGVRGRGIVVAYTHAAPGLKSSRQPLGVTSRREVRGSTEQVHVCPV